MIEALWNAAHRTSWFPSWWCFQAAAVAIGAIVLGRARLKAFALGVVAAAGGAIVLANGADWASWLVHGAAGPPPPLEVAGFGALAGLVAGFLFAAEDRAAAARALALTVGPMLAVARLGCFFAGCDFGKPSTMPWALRYPHWTPAFATQLDAHLITTASPLTLPVHPTQLYESALGVALFLLARRRPSLSLVVASYAAGRFALDFLRGDQPHGALGLTASQLLALAALGLSVVSANRARDVVLHRRGPLPDAPHVPRIP